MPFYMMLWCHIFITPLDYFDAARHFFLTCFSLIIIFMPHFRHFHISTWCHYCHVDYFIHYFLRLLLFASIIFFAAIIDFSLMSLHIHFFIIFHIFLFRYADVADTFRHFHFFADYFFRRCCHLSFFWCCYFLHYFSSLTLLLRLFFIDISSSPFTPSIRHFDNIDAAIIIFDAIRHYFRAMAIISLYWLLRHITLITPTLRHYAIIADTPYCFFSHISITLSFSCFYFAIFISLSLSLWYLASFIIILIRGYFHILRFSLAASTFHFLLIVYIYWFLSLRFLSTLSIIFHCWCRLLMTLLTLPPLRHAFWYVCHFFFAITYLAEFLSPIIDDIFSFYIFLRYRLRHLYYFHFEDYAIFFEIFAYFSIIFFSILMIIFFHLDYFILMPHYIIFANIDAAILRRCHWLRLAPADADIITIIADDIDYFARPLRFRLFSLLRWLHDAIAPLIIYYAIIFIFIYRLSDAYFDSHTFLSDELIWLSLFTPLFHYFFAIDAFDAATLHAIIYFH